MTDVALVADDHALLRRAVTALLKDECAVNDALEADSLDAMLSTIRARSDIVLVVIDPCMAGVESISVLQQIRLLRSDLRIVVLSQRADRNYIFEALSAGAHGFVRKTAPLATITTAIRHVLDGQIYLPPETAAIDTPVESPSRQANLERLTPRQLEIVGYLREGASNKQIARRLSLSESTVKVHANAAYRVLGIRDRREIAGAVPFDDSPANTRSFKGAMPDTMKAKAPIH